MGKVTWTDVGLVIVAIILPPLAVFLKSEEFSKGAKLCFNTSLTDARGGSKRPGTEQKCSHADFVLNCLLSIFGWLPGQIHAIWFVVSNPVRLITSSLFPLCIVGALLTVKTSNKAFTVP